MFKIDKIEENNGSLLILKNSNAIAKINLNDGARLQDLSFNNVSVIKEDPLFDYKNSFASSILFPFVNRMPQGKYSFQDKEYQFICNETERNNALHGLVYNKEFLLLENEVYTNKCTVVLGYKEKLKQESFPFTYEIYLTYTLTETDLSLSIKIKNTDTSAFPYTLGWHPYFYSSNLKESTLSFKSDKKVEFDENLITKSLIDYKEENVFKVQNQQLDDCYVLDDDKIGFETPNYQLQITSSVKDNYLQMYTPKDLPLIAIEPMIGISNSFNNKIGLHVLEPNESYSLTWNLNVKTH